MVDSKNYFLINSKTRAETTFISLGHLVCQISIGNTFALSNALLVVEKLNKLRAV